MSDVASSKPEAYPSKNIGRREALKTIGKAVGVAAGLGTPLAGIAGIGELSAETEKWGKAEHVSTGREAQIDLNGKDLIPGNVAGKGVVKIVTEEFLSRLRVGIEMEDANLEKAFPIGVSKWARMHAEYKGEISLGSKIDLAVRTLRPDRVLSSDPIDVVTVSYLDPESGERFVFNFNNGPRDDRRFRSEHGEYLAIKPPVSSRAREVYKQMPQILVNAWNKGVKTGGNVAVKESWITAKIPSKSS